MKRHKITAKRWTFVQLLTASCLIAGCEDLTRFEQERYECGYNPDGLVEIDFRNFDEGEETNVVFNDGTATMQIIESSDTHFVLTAPGLIVRVDRGSSTIRYSLPHCQMQKVKFPDVGLAKLMLLCQDYLRP